LNNVKAIFWDLGGQNSFRVIWDKYYNEAHGLIYVVDSSDENRLNEAVTTFEDLIKHTDLANIPVLIMANKQDLNGACSIEKIEEKFHVADVLRSRPCQVQLCSAYTREGIEDAMNYLMEKVKSVERI
jgi:ADP-ribosylation factor related protein 1